MLIFFCYINSNKTYCFTRVLGEIRMKISTKGRYGVAAMYDLALHYGEGPVALKQIALRQEISENYLEQLISTLRNAGYVNSIRGPQGGYILAKDPKDITIGDVIKTMEGPITLVDCLLTDDSENNYCEKVGKCVTRDVWVKVRDSINNVLNSISLADLCKDERK